MRKVIRYRPNPDSQGAALAHTSSDPFGYKAQTGYYTDNETGLQLLTHRYYDPASGRFLTRDPIGYAGGINLYSYVRNNPSNYADPSGLNPEQGVMQLWPYAPILLPAIGALAAEAAVPAAIIADYGALLYGAWKFGEWTAAQPWNPLTHPSVPLVPPFCPTTPLPRSTPITFAPPPPPTPNENDERCNKLLYEVDYPTCDAIGRVRGATAYRRCIASAHQRYAACLRGQPLPPLDTWNN